MKVDNFCQKAVKGITALYNKELIKLDLSALSIFLNVFSNIMIGHLNQHNKNPNLLPIYLVQNAVFIPRSHVNAIQDT